MLAFSTAIYPTHIFRPPPAGGGWGLPSPPPPNPPSWSPCDPPSSVSFLVSPRFTGWCPLFLPRARIYAAASELSASAGKQPRLPSLYSNATRVTTLRNPSGSIFTVSWPVSRRQDCSVMQRPRDRPTAPGLMEEPYTHVPNINTFLSE